MPSPGTIDVLRVPSGPGVRDDSAAFEGAEISMHYDPLVSKLCVWAANREFAVARMRRALSEYVVTGIKTNLPFHLALLEHPDFIAGSYDTGFIARHEETLLTSGSTGGAEDALAIGAAIASAYRDRDAAAVAPSEASNGAAMSPWRLATIAKM